MSIDPRARAKRELISSEVDASTARITEHAATLHELENETDTLLFDLYGLTIAQRARIDSEYRP